VSRLNIEFDKKDCLIQTINIRKIDNLDEFRPIVNTAAEENKSPDSNNEETLTITRTI